MTKEKLKQLNEMEILLDGLAAVTDSLNKPDKDITIVCGFEDYPDTAMSVRRNKDFEQAFGDFIRTYYCRTQKAFDDA